MIEAILSNPSNVSNAQQKEVSLTLYQMSSVFEAGLSLACIVILHNWFKDSLMQKVGVVKAYWEDKEDVNKESYKNLTEDELALLLSDPGIKVVSQNVEMMDAGIDQMGMPIQVPLYNVKVKKTKKYGCVRIENVPPEEFLISKSARTIQDSPFVAHRRLMTRTDLIAMGFDKDLVEGLPSYDDLQFTPERVARFSRQTAYHAQNGRRCHKRDT